MKAKPGPIPKAKRPTRAAAARPLRLHSIEVDYKRVQKLRKKALAQLDSDGLSVESYRGGKKANPLLAVVRDLDAQLLKLRALLEEQRASEPHTPAGAARGNESYELRVQEYLNSDSEMCWLIDDQGQDPPGDSSWRSDPRVIEKRRQVQ